jgi:hypothetical protein
MADRFGPQVMSRQLVRDVKKILKACDRFQIRFQTGALERSFADRADGFRQLAQ